MTTTSKRDSFLEVPVPPGEVLTCGPIFFEPQDNCSKTLPCCLCPPFGKKREKVQSERMYLQCRGTTTGIDVLLPLETYGQFSSIGTSQSSPDEEEEGPTTTSRPPFVYQMKDLVNRKNFPQKVQLVHGTPPPPSEIIQSKSSFTGLMALGGTYSEQSIIACQIRRGERSMAFVEFPDDSELEFLLANNWEGDASVLKAVDFCQQYSNSYELEIQPIIEDIRLRESAGILGKDSVDVYRSGTFRKRSSDEIIRPESFDSESAPDPTSQQRSAHRVQSEDAVPKIPQRVTKIPTGFQRRRFIPHTPQSTTAVPTAAPRRTVAGCNSSAWRRDARSLDNTSWTDRVVQDYTVVGNSTQRTPDAAVQVPNSPENENRGYLVNRMQARFTKSLERHQSKRKAIALVHTPRPSKDLHRSKSEHDHHQNIIRYSPGRMTDRKLPPLPSQMEAIEDVGESNDGFQESSSEVESSSSDPEKLYERIPCQKEVSNEPSASAPSSPAPTIRHRQETPIAVSPFAYDQDGYLTPVELRDIGPALEKGRERISFTGSFGSAGNNCKKKLGQNLYSSHRRYFITSQMDRIPFDRRYDSERLQSFLDDSVAELYRKQLHTKDSEQTMDNSRDRLYQRNYSLDNTSRKRQRSLSTPDFPNQDFPRDEIDVNLETILDCEDVELDKEEEEDYSSRFLRRISSTSLQTRRLNPAPYHGFDSTAFSDSGIASRQSTMRNDSRERGHWKAMNILWRPPEDLSSLTVEEVAMSLRYIGMKDQIAVGFSKEQVDGKLLGEMDNHLLKEGFPNMNSLERKKVLDFVQGWRPKRLLFM